MSEHDDYDPLAEPFTEADEQMLRGIANIKLWKEERGALLRALREIKSRDAEVTCLEAHIAASAKEIKTLQQERRNLEILNEEWEVRVDELEIKLDAAEASGLDRDLLT
jgi:hypothetical protein